MAGTGRRAQSSIDFAVSMGIFLVVVAVVFAFLPQMIEPFSTSGAENSLISDRVAIQLTEYQLAGESPGALETSCTLFFFNETTSDDPPCDSFDSGTSLNERLGVDSAVQVNVTLEQRRSGSSEILCGDLTSDAVTDPPCGGSSEYRLAIGDSADIDVGSVSVARRTVFIDGRQDAILIVRVWS